VTLPLLYMFFQHNLKRSAFFVAFTRLTLAALLLTQLPAAALAQATIPPGCTTPGDCDELTPSFQNLNVKTNGLIDNQGDLRLGEADVNGSNFVGLQAPTNLSTDLTFTLPSTLGTNGQILTTDSSGNLTWTSITNYTAGAGLDLTGSTFSLDINSLATDSVNNSTDQIAIYDADTGTVRKISRNTFLSPVLGALVYQGAWNASTNTPTLTNGTGTQGQYYIASHAGTQNLGSGNITFNVGDYIIHNGTRYELLENAAAVSTVFGRIGAVTAQSGDYSAAQITNIPAGSIAATTAQTALNELDTEKLSTTLNSANIFVGNGGNVATGVPISGDAALANNGALTITNDAITSTKILNNAVTSTKIATNSIDGTKIALGSDAQGDTMYYNGTDWIRLPKGTAGQVLTMNAGATAPEWAAAAVGSTTLAALTDVDVTGLTTGSVLYYDGTDWVDLGLGTAGQALVVNPGATAPMWSGFTGQIVDYGQYTYTNTAGFSISTNDTAIPLDTVVSGSIPLSANRITLSANKTYRLVGVVPYTGNGSANIDTQFYNVTGSAYIGSTRSAILNATLANTAYNEVIFTPSVTTQVEFRVRSVAGGAYSLVSGDISRQQGPSVTIQQLGSSATTVFTGANGTVAGTAGFIPAPAATDNTKYLKGDGTWSTVAPGSSTLAALTDVDVTGSATGAMLYYNGTDWIDIGIGSVGNVLRVNSAGDAPEWATAGGQMVDYYSITWSAGTTASPSIGSAYNFSVGTVRTQSGNIPFNGTSNWTLTAGKTYRLTASMAAGSVNASQVAWYDDTTGLPISNNNASGQDNGSTNITTSGSADVIITPETDRTVSLRALTSQSLLLVRSSVTIQQLGSSATTVFTGANGTVAGTAGFIPAPAATDNTRYLKGDGTWADLAGATFGDVKSGIQTADHGGWIRLDGRLKSTLTATQQARATALGVGTNLPSASGAYLSQNGGTLGAVTGANTKNIAQNNLPNVTLGTDTQGSHTHGSNATGNAGQAGLIFETGGGNNTVATADASSGEPDLVTSPTALSITAAGSHSHTTTSINGGVAQVAFDVRPLTLTVNMFIYLGN
jgi:hypothetical protein